MLNTNVYTAGPTGSWLISPVLLMFLIFVLFSALLDFLFALKAEFLLLLNFTSIILILGQTNMTKIGK